MCSMLQKGQKLQAEGGELCVVEELLGSGGQGEVYRVRLGGKTLALKWYFTPTPEQHQALALLLQKGAPTNRFLWPLMFVYDTDKSNFGYLMPLRESRYRGLDELMRRRIHPLPTFYVLATAGLYLADSYYHLHIQGLCYRDISLGNAFFDPKNGEVLICDNDNVTVNGDTTGGVAGTPRFMAPEIVRREAYPSTNTDLFSLAVLLFHLFIFHHPLDGKREADIHVLDGLAMNRLYGTDPLFIFDPHDRSNEPVRGYQDNALLCWPIYPQFLKALFIRAFTDGLRDPEHGRVRENEWRAAMLRLRDSIYYCHHCQAENFYDVEALRTNGGMPIPCWKCQKQPILPFRMRIQDTIVMLNQDSKLFPHHIDSQQKYNVSQPIAEVVRHPKDPTIWGLKNLSGQKWVLTRPDGSLQEIEVQKSAQLIAGTRINFGTAEGEIRY